MIPVAPLAMIISVMTSRNRERLILLAILAIGLALRAIYLFELPKSPDFRYPLLDHMYHDYWARLIAFGDTDLPVGAADPLLDSNPYLRPPGYPFFLAGIYKLFGTNPYIPRIIQMLLGLSSAVLVYVLCRKWFCPAVALVAALLMSVNWVFLYYEGKLHAPSLLVFLSILTIYTLGLLTGGLKPTRALYAGLTLGLLASVRPNVLTMCVAAPLWIAWLAWRRKQHRLFLPTVLAFAAGVALVVAPAAIRNYKVTGDFTLISANGGINFFFGNNSLSDGVSAAHPETGAWSCFDYPRIVMDLESRLGKSLTHAEADAHFTALATTFIREWPIEALRLTARKALLFWSPREITSYGDVESERHHSSVLSRLPLPFAVTLSLCLTGLLMFIADFRRRDETSPAEIEARADVVLIMVLFVLAYSTTLIMFIVSGRYRVPIQPFLFVGTAYAVVGFGRCVIARTVPQVIAWPCVFAALLACVLLNPVDNPMQQESWHLHRSRAFQQAGKWGSAANELEQAIAINPNNAQIQENLARCYANVRRLGEAIGYYEKALQLDPELVSAHVGIGKALARTGAMDRAVEHFETAVRISPNYDEALMCLGSAMAMQGNTRAAASHFQAVLKVNPQRTDAHLLLAQLMIDTRQPEAAAVIYRKVLQRWPDNAEARAGLEALSRGEK